MLAFFLAAQTAFFKPYLANPMSILGHRHIRNCPGIAAINNPNSHRCEPPIIFLGLFAFPLFGGRNAGTRNLMANFAAKE
jgi:hypothetical protein